MISESARFHGSFFILLFEAIKTPVSVQRLTEYGVGYYLLNDRIPVYLKLSTKRKGPWTFNFFKSHQETQNRLYSEYGECFTCLICGKDGVAGLNMTELRQILDLDFEEQESISVRRPLKTMYQIKGRDGILEKRVSRQSIFNKIEKEIEMET